MDKLTTLSNDRFFTVQVRPMWSVLKRYRFFMHLGYWSHCLCGMVHSSLEAPVSPWVGNILLLQRTSAFKVQGRAWQRSRRILRVLSNTKRLQRRECLRSEKGDEREHLHAVASTDSYHVNIARQNPLCKFLINFLGLGPISLNVIQLFKSSLQVLHKTKLHF